MPKGNSPQQQKQIDEAFESLPPVLQESFSNGEISNLLRDMAKKFNMHLDQWEKLEQVVQLAILNVYSADDLPNLLRTEVHVEGEVQIAELTRSINDGVFEPLRKKLEDFMDKEGMLEDEEEEEPMTDEELAVITGTATPEQIKAAEAALAPAKEASAELAAPPQPATPAAPAPTEKAVRAPVSVNYGAGQASSERPIIQGDPYREQTQ